MLTENRPVFCPTSTGKNKDQQGFATRLNVTDQKNDGNYEFAKIEAKWQAYWLKNKHLSPLTSTQNPNITFSICFHIHLETASMLDMQSNMSRPTSLPGTKKCVDIMFFIPWVGMPMDYRPNNTPSKQTPIPKWQLRRTSRISANRS